MFPHEQFKKRTIENDEFYLSKNEFLPIRDKRVFQIIRGYFLRTPCRPSLSPVSSTGLNGAAHPCIYVCPLTDKEIPRSVPRND